MKKSVFIFAFIIFHFFISAQNDLVSIARKEYRTANKDSLSCAKLFTRLINAHTSPKPAPAYKGAVTMMYAGFVKNKAEKLKLFKSGHQLLEKEIAEDRENPELILLRFTIQSYAPKILGYNKELENDKALLLRKFDSIENKEVKESARSFLLQSKLLTAAEKAKLK